MVNREWRSSGVLVDSNVILDVVEDDDNWCEWSLSTLERIGESNQLVINPIVYAEVSIGFEMIEEVEDVLAKGGFRLIPIPKEALFLAGKAFLRYRHNQGKKSSPLPDFFIGAHAATVGMTLVTRDTKRVKSYFPTVNLISP